MATEKVSGWRPWCKDCKSFIGETLYIKNPDASKSSEATDHKKQKGMHRVISKSATMRVPKQVSRRGAGQVAKGVAKAAGKGAVDKTAGAVIRAVRDRGGRAASRLNDRLSRGECIGCGKRTRTGASHPECVRKEAIGLQTAGEAQAQRMDTWNKITGGIRYDVNGKRIWD